MMFKRRGRLSLFSLVIFVIAIPEFIQSQKSNAQLQKEALRDAFSALLNFKSPPNLESGGQRANKPSGNLNAEYMKQLLAAHKAEIASGNAPKDKGNTVRCFSPTYGKVGGKTTLKYQLQALKPSERVLRAEVFYNFKLGRFNKALKSSSNSLRCFAVLPKSTGSGSTRLVELRQTERGDGHVTFDATRAITQLTSPTLAVLFAQQRKDGSFRHLPLNKIARFYAPFLLVFSDDTPTAEKQQLATAADSIVESYLQYRGEAKVELSQLSHQQDGEAAVEENNQHGTRLRRSVQDTDASYYAYVLALPTDSIANCSQPQSRIGSETGFGTGSGSGNKTLPPIANAAAATPLYNGGVKALFNNKEQQQRNKDEIPIPKGYKGFNGKLPKERNRKQKENKEKGPRTIPSDWQKPSKLSREEPSLVILKSKQHQETCQKHDLVVEFGDIGWGDWIISPKSFEAHFCFGFCSFPLTKQANPTNHAMIQSIIHKIGLHPTVPSPCCAPDKMDSLTLLYFDEDQNVVLKNYPKMSVKSCGCL